MKKIYVIDNYDSFVYNIIHIIKSLGVDEIKVVKNDQVYFNEIFDYSHILLSPGPGTPSEAGYLMDVIEKCHTTHSILLHWHII